MIRANDSVIPIDADVRCFIQSMPLGCAGCIPGVHHGKRQSFLTMELPSREEVSIMRDRINAEYVWVETSRYAAGCWMMRTLVTNAMYRAAIDAGACTRPIGALGDRLDAPGYVDHPVVNVSRADALAYAAWVAGRLPTSAEWTSASSGNTSRTYPWGNRAPDALRANFGRQAGDTTPVGRYPAGAARCGALDLAGNACEWVMAPLYTVRGGSFRSDAGDLRCMDASTSHEDLRSILVGFRVVRSADTAS
jgi:formylglycine-generating enzyme required for sulfatase activity